jgi:hypothetical protein
MAPNRKSRMALPSLEWVADGSRLASGPEPKEDLDAMRDIELYRHLLGIESPWAVTRVDLNVPDQRVDVWAGHEEQTPWSCPECGANSPLYDHAEERVWRHLDSCQFRTRPARTAATGTVSDARGSSGTTAMG